MIFDFDDEDEPPNLEDFKLKLVVASLRKSFYQNEHELEYNMLKFPLIIAPGLLGTQVNYDTKARLL